MSLISEIFDDPDLSVIWMNDPHPYLNYQKPMLAIADGKTDLVIKILEYIKYQLTQNL